MSWLRDLHGDHTVRITPSQVYRLLVCFVISVLPQLGNVSIWLLLITAALVAWRVQIEWQGAPLPSNVVKLLLGFALFLGVYVQKGTLAGKDAGTALMVGLIAIKFLELRGRRDYMVLTFVLYFMCMTALLFEQSMMVFVYVLAASSLLTMNLISLHLVGSGPEPSRAPIAFALRMLAQSLPLALILFLFFPRIDTKLGFNLGGDSTGLPPSIKAGSFSTLMEDSTMVFRADFGQSPSPPISALYWRAFVLGTYNAVSNQWDETQAMVEPNVAKTLRGGRLVEQHITLRPHSQRWLFALDYPASNTWNNQAELRSGHVLQIREGLRRKIQYTVFSRVDSHPSGLSSMMEKASLLIGGEDQIRPEVKELAQSFRTPHATDVQVVENALNYFRANHFVYTTRAEDYGDDPLYDFLFVKRRGFCEHYASAFGVLMRLAKVPVRLVAGYQGGEYNPYGNFIIVRQLNAHAWTEVYIKDQGWTRVDPTTLATPSDLPQVVRGPNSANPDAAPSQPILGNLGTKLAPTWVKQLMTEGRFRWQLVEEIWDYWVLSYNPEFQSNILKDLGLDTFIWELFFIMGGFALVLTIILVARSLHGKRTPEDQLQEIYDEFCRRVEESGVSRNDWEGPTKYATRAAKVLDHAAEPIKKFSHDYAFLRYGHISHLEPALEPLREKMERVKEALEEAHKQMEEKK